MISSLKILKTSFTMQYLKLKILTINIGKIILTHLISTMTLTSRTVANPTRVRRAMGLTRGRRKALRGGNREHKEWARSAV